MPYGLRAVAVFPAYFHHYGYGDFVQYSPSECVVFAEDEPPIYHYKRQQRRYKRKARNRSVAAKKRRYHYTTPVVYSEYHELLYGFRCIVTVVDHKVCNSSSYECETIKDYEAVYGNGNAGALLEFSQDGYKLSSSLEVMKFLNSAPF